MSEALECWACNSALDWDGDVPDDETDILCHACELDAKESEVARLTARVRELEEALLDAIDLAEDAVPYVPAVLAAKWDYSARTLPLYKLRDAILADLAGKGE